MGTLGGVAVMQAPVVLQWVAIELAVMVLGGTVSLLCLRVMDHKERAR